MHHFESDRKPIRLSPAAHADMHRHSATQMRALHKLLPATGQILHNRVPFDILIDAKSDNNEPAILMAASVGSSRFHLQRFNLTKFRVF